MNEELVQKFANFIETQSPDIANEILLRATMMDWTIFSISSVVCLVCLRVFFMKFEDGFPVKVCVSIVGALSTLILFICTMDLFSLYYTPKLYILEQISHLIRG